MNPTRKQLLMKLPHPINVMALENVKREESHRIKEYLSDRSYINTSNALISSFCWDITPEGGDFWDAVYEECLHLEQEGKL